MVMTDVVINGQQGPEFPVEAQCFLARANWSEVIDRDACAVKKTPTKGLRPRLVGARTILCVGGGGS